MDTIRLAHLSDLHFSKFSLNPKQFFSKRWIGNLNLLMKRGKLHLSEQVHTIFEAIKDKSVRDVLITGDLTTTSYHKEFAIAQGFVRHLESRDYGVHIIPGNHDHYTKKAGKEKRFYRFFEGTSEALEPFKLKSHGTQAAKLTNSWWLVLLDTTKATELHASTGEFSKEVEKNLETLLKQIPQEDFIILANHFPFFQNESPRRILEGGQRLEELIRKFPQIKLYAHGHTHRRCLADLRQSGLPIVLDSGSLSHRDKGSWSIIELGPRHISIEFFSLSQGIWKLDGVQRYSLDG